MNMIGEDAPKTTKCPVKQYDKDRKEIGVCGKDLLHEGKYSTYGTNERNDGVTGIALRRLKRFNFLKSNRNRDHFFCREAKNGCPINPPYQHPDGKTKIGKQPESIEGHHLITIECVQEDEWYCLFYAMSYDINCPANCVLLPGDMLSACHYGVPRHKGNHSATIGDIEAKLNYVESVRALIKPVKDKYEKGDFCKKLEKKDLIDFHNYMLKKSDEILKKITTFTWTISSEGRDFMPGGVGCYGGHRSTEDKLNDMQKAMSDEKAGDDGFSRAKYSMKFIKDKTIHRPCTRDHSSEGCEGGGTKMELTKSMLRMVGADAVVPAGGGYVDWDKCKFNDIDEKIKKMKD